MEYRELTKRDGTKVVICNFEKLLTEAYGVETMEEVHNFINQGNGEYLCHCPFCRLEGHQSGFTARKLYINDEFTLGHCFVCGRAFVNVDDILKFNVPDINYITACPSDWRVISYLEAETIDPKVKESNLAKGIKNFNEYAEFDQRGYDYLLGRHGFLKDLIKPLGIRFDSNGNPVIPFKYGDEVIYYQTRKIKLRGKNDPKYDMPAMLRGTKPPYIIEVGDKKKLIICEGVYDSMSLLIQAPGWTPVAICGSQITDYQIQFLREYVPSEIKIYMDKTELSNGILRKLKKVIDYCPISVVWSDGTDPEENLKKRLTWAKSVADLQWIY